MSLNFFEISCQERALNIELFGLCDDQKGGKAFTSITDPEKWIATVKNKNKLLLTFTAIDKCVIKDNEEPGRGRCDGMITSENCLYLIELKDALPPWQSDAIEQLESTVQFILENHDISQYQLKKVFACNKKSEKFRVIDNDFNLTFYRKYGFRIDIQAEIIIV